MKVVLDANVIVAAFASRGLCEAILELCLSEHEIILCAGLLEEVLTNLRTKIGLPAGVVEGIRSLFQEYATLVEPVSLPEDICRDPDDVKVLGLAVASGANCIVTGDKDLLVLEEWQGVSILTPRAFSDMVRSG